LFYNTNSYERFLSHNPYFFHRCVGEIYLTSKCAQGVGPVACRHGTLYCRISLDSIYVYEEDTSVRGSEIRKLLAHIWHTTG